MKPLHLKLGVVGATLSLSAIAFSQLGTPPQGVTQPLASAPGTVVIDSIAEGYFVTNGASYYTRNGQAFKVEREVSIRVTPVGIVGFDGQPLNLPAGMMLTPDGRHAPIPAAINRQALPGNADPFPSSPSEVRRPAVPTPAGGAVIRDTPELQVEPTRQR